MIATFHVTVLFGSDQVRKFNNAEIFSEEDIFEYAKLFQFKTQNELDAFILGLEAGNGWLDLVYLEGVKIVNPLSLQIQKQV